MPESTEVTLRYAGPDVDDGSIGVDDLLSALNGFSSAFYRLAERESLDDKQRIKVNGISKSSANIHLAILDLAAAHPLVATAASGVVVAAGKKIVEIVIEKLAGVAKAKRHIQNSPYTTAQDVEVHGDKNLIIVVNGNDAKLPVDRDVLEILQKGIIDSDLDKMASPLREDAVNSFEIRHGDKEAPDLHIAASEKSYFARARKEKTRTQELSLTGTMMSLSKNTNGGTFITDAGRRIRYKFTNEEKLAELYQSFSHLGLVVVRCTAKLDDNLDVIAIEISDVETVSEYDEVRRSLASFRAGRASVDIR